MKTLSQKREVSTFARPGRALESWTKVFFPEFVSGVNGRQRGEATHAEHGIGSEFADDFFRGLDRLVERPEEGDHLRGERSGFRDRRDDLEIQVWVFRGCLGVDFLLGNEQQRLVALREESFGYRDAGKQVAAGATAGDEDFSRRCHW
jgi:hypothetical protein